MNALGANLTKPIEFESKIRFVENLTDLLRHLLLGFSVLIIITLSGIFFAQNTPILQPYIRFAAYLSAAIFMIIGVKKSQINKRIMAKNPNVQSAILIAKGDAPIKKTPLWDIHLKQISGENAKIKIQDLHEPFDKYLLVIFVVCAALFAIFRSQILGVLSFSSQVRNLPNDINILVIPPDNIGLEEFALNDANRNAIPVNSRIIVNNYSNTIAPKISFAKHEIPSELKDGKYSSQFIAENGGVLKIQIGKMNFSQKLGILKDTAPRIKSFSGVIEYQKGNPIIDISAIDNYGISRAELEISGKINNNFKSEKLNLPIDASKSLNRKIILDTAQSIFIGRRVFARIYLYDVAGNHAATRFFSINIHTPEFATPLARALNEIRLDILQESGIYKPQTNEKFRFYDKERAQEVIIDTETPIEGAPPKIKAAHTFLMQLALYGDGTDSFETIAPSISYIIGVLDSAKSTKDAQKIGPLLWSLIELGKDPPPNAQSLIAQKINELKSALARNADDSEIEGLKRELQNAINQHVQELAQKQNQSGDMEIEDNSNIDGDKLANALDNINSQTDPNDAAAQLDALSQMLQNLQVTQTEEGQGDAKDYIGAQKNILDETIAENNPSNLSVKQDALVRELMEKNQGQDKNLEDAINAMKESSQSLQNNDLENAIDAQKRAIESLIRSKDGANNAQNPMNQGPNSQNPQPPKEGEKIINKADDSKNRTIFQKLRELLGMPDKDEKEKKYYEDLMRME